MQLLLLLRVPSLMIFEAAAAVVVVVTIQWLSPPGYQAPVVKASRCGNKRQERSDWRKVGSGKTS